MKTYSPPALGIIAASSAYVSAPARLRRPATTQTVMTIPGVPTLHVITRDLRKTPVPMTSPITIAIAARAPSPRTSPTSGVAGGTDTAISHLAGLKVLQSTIYALQTRE